MTRLFYHSWRGNAMRYGNVNVEKTKENFGVFILAYWTARQSIRRPMEVTIQQLINEPLADIENYSDDALPRKIDAKEFNYLHQLYIKGFDNIAIPSSFKNSKERTKRRKKIFYDNMIRGYSQVKTALRHYTSEDSVQKEIRKAIIQFCQELDIVEYKKG